MNRENIEKAVDIDDQLVGLEDDVAYLEKMTDVSCGALLIWHGSGVFEIALTDEELELFYDTVESNRKATIEELKAELGKL